MIISGTHFTCTWPDGQDKARVAGKTKQIYTRLTTNTQPGISYTDQNVEQCEKGV